MRILKRTKALKKQLVFLLIFAMMLPMFTWLEYIAVSASSRWVRVDDKDTRITYTGEWLNWDDRGAGTYMETESYSSDTNATATFTFNGNQVRMISKKDPMQGAANIIIDGGTPVVVDCYSSVIEGVQMTVFESPILEEGEHTVMIQPLDRQGLAYSIDAIEYATAEETDHKNTNDLWTKVDDNDSSVTYSENWNTSSVEGSYGGSVHSSDVKDSTVTFSFTGTKARFYGAKKDAVGIASVYVDDEYQTNIDCKDASVNSYDYFLYETPLLPYGKHTLTVEVLHLTSGGGDTGCDIIVDAFSSTSFDYDHTITYEVENAEESGFVIWGNGVSATEDGVLFDQSGATGGRESVLQGPSVADIPYGKYNLEIYLSLLKGTEDGDGSNVIMGLDVQDTDILNLNVTESEFGEPGTAQKLTYPISIPMGTVFTLRFWWDKNTTILVDKVVLTPVSPDLSTEVTINTEDTGRMFEGIGALSASSSNLLYDYEEPYRSDILDYLFKPNFGAAYQHLKVEIGGDGNSTCQTEPAYARTLEEFELVQSVREQCENGTIDRNSEDYLKVKEYFNRGVEFWLMKEAKKRNPDIFLDVLQWSAPGWFRYDGTYGPLANPDTDYETWKKQKFYTQDNADYIATYIWGAKEFHDLDIDFCGIWNEHYNPDRNDWIITLRETLDRYDLTDVKIIAAEHNDWAGIWNSALQLTATPELREAVYAIGVHYPNWGSPNPYHDNSEAQATGKPLYSSEDGSIGGSWEATLKSARIFNANYIENRIVKTVFWSNISAAYDWLSGAMQANTPWSGYYKVEDGIWGFAHTTQFTKPGWNYIDNACGYLDAGGSYVALQDNGTADNRKSNPDFSVIVETGGATDTQIMDVTLNGMSNHEITVWKTEKGNTFQKVDTITPKDGNFSYVVDPDCIYSFTTTTGQQKGEAETAIPEDEEFPMSYEDDFDSYQSGERPKYFSDQGGGFEIYEDGASNRTLRQSVPTKPVCWWNDYEPFSYVGNKTLHNCVVSADVKIEETGYGGIYSRVSGPTAYGQTHPYGYGLRIDETGTWKLTRYKAKAGVALGSQFEVLQQGKVSGISADSWINLKMICKDNKIRGFINDEIVFEYIDEENSFIQGRAAVGSSYDYVQFDNFKIVSLDGDNTYIMVDDNDESITYEGVWGIWPPESTDPTAVHYTEYPSGAESATFTFNGVKARFYGSKRNDLGILEVYVDGEKKAEIDQCSNGSQGDVLLYETELLEPGTHTLKIVPTDRKNPASSGIEAIINGFSYTNVAPVIVHPESVKVNQSEITLEVNQKQRIYAIVSPDTVTDDSVIWESDNPDVASVDDRGEITAHKAGTAAITVTTVDGELTVQCVVTVTEETTDPTDPEDPDNPGTEDPDNPGTEDPDNPGTDDPDDPGTEDPDDPGTEDPDNPGTEDPDNPGTEDPDNPEPTAPNGQLPSEDQQNPQTAVWFPWGAAEAAMFAGLCAYSVKRLGGRHRKKES